MHNLYTKIRNLSVAAGIVVTLSCSTVLTPLWIDSINKSNNSLQNDSNNSFDNYKHMDIFALIFIVNFVYAILSGVLFLFYILFLPSKISQEDRQFPKFPFLVIGISDALCTICVVYASSGSRTAPYLQSIAANFGIPVTFFIRFLVLRKKPTLRKLCFAGLVLLAEFIALIPQIFSLEGSAEHTNDGGATGIAGVLWPLCYFIGFIPAAFVTVIMEKVTKTKLSSTVEDSLHPVVFMFWTYLFCFCGLCLMFWTDVIPGFGGAKNFNEFWNLFTFNILCFIGVDDCDSRSHICSILTIIAMLITRVLSIIFLKFSEGANYLVIIMSLQTPVVLLFWTVFVEEPFHFHPHQDLSTWLSLVAVAIMLPSIYFYSTGPAEIQLPINNTKDDKEPLIREKRRYSHGYLTKSSDSYQSIDIVASSSDDQAVYNPYVQNFTDSYQSIASLDSSINSFRNSFVSS